MKPFITNTDIANDLKRYVAQIKLFPDGKEPGTYYYKKTLNKKERQNLSTIISAIEAYQGSSRGNNVPSVDFMEDWKNSTRAPEVTLLVQNPPERKIGFWEQYYTTMHREDFPDDVTNSKKNCYNMNNADRGAKKFGVVSKKQMMEYISIEKLQNEITRQNEEKTNLFEKISLSRDLLKEIEDADRFKQSRAEVKKITSVIRYKEEQNKLSDLKDDFSHLQVYLPEDPNELPEIGDGNQSYYAFKLVLQHDEMWGYGIPYVWHKHISHTKKLTMGNWFNKKPEDAGDWTDDPDILKDLRNTIVANEDVILNDDRIPNMDSPLIDQCFQDQRLIQSEIKSLKRTVLTEYRNKKSEDDRLQGNVWNFGDRVINPNGSKFYPDDHDAYHKILKEVLKQFPKYSGNVKKVGEQKIHEDSTDSILKNMVDTGGHFPEYLLVVVWTKTINSYELHTRGAGLIRNRYLKKLLGLAIKNLQIVIFNPEKNTKVPTFFTVEDLNG